MNNLLHRVYNLLHHPPLTQIKSITSSTGCITSSSTHPQLLSIKECSSNKLNKSQNEVIFREDFAGPIPENITISEEVQQEDKDTASKPSLRLASSEPCLLHAQAQEGKKDLSAALMAKFDQIRGSLEKENQILARFQPK